VAVTSAAAGPLAVDRAVTGIVTGVVTGIVTVELRNVFTNVCLLPICCVSAACVAASLRFSCHLRGVRCQPRGVVSSGVALRSVLPTHLCNISIC
jgi:hypothetical protein